MLYLSGPITGDPNYKIKFRAAKQQLELRGYDVINPAELDDVLPVARMTHEDILQICEELLIRCDAIILMPGWETSLGCQRERGYAEGADLIVLPLEEMLRM